MKGKTCVKGTSSASITMFTVSVVLYNKNVRTPGPFTTNIPAALLAVNTSAAHWMESLADASWAAFTPDLSLVFTHMKEVTRYPNLFTFPYTRNNKWVYFSLDGSRATHDKLGSQSVRLSPAKGLG